MTGDLGAPDKPLTHIGEFVQLVERTSDPTSHEQGEAWLRTDLAPETNQLATLRFDHGSGIWNIPVFSTGTSEPEIEEVLRIAVNGTVGYIPITTESPAFSEIGFQHAGVRYGLHNDVSLVSFEATVSLNGGSATAYVYEDTDLDGVPENTEVIPLQDGNNSYDLPSFNAGSGNDYWATIVYEQTDITSWVEASLINILGLEWSSDADWEVSQDRTAVVHDSIQDHRGSGLLAQGYEYDQDLTRGLVGWWPLAWSNGRDLSGNGNHGVLNGGVATKTAGRAGLRAYAFDGIDDVVNPDSSGSEFSSSTLTVMFWARAADTNLEYAAGDGGLWRIRPEPGNDRGLFWYRQSDSTIRTIAGGSVNLDEWHHYALVIDASTDQAEAFIDATSIGTETATNGANNANGNLSIGDGYDTQGNYFTGGICDVRWYDRALSAAQIQSLYDWGSVDLAQPADNNRGGVSYYPFNSANADDAWGSNDGTVNGASHLASGGPRGDGAYSFDGTDDYIDTNFSPSLPYTFSFWINWDGTAAGSPLDAAGIRASSGSETEFQFYKHSNDTWGYYDGSQNDLGVPAVADTWYHIVYATDSLSSGTFYINGESSPVSPSFTNETRNLLIGTPSTSGGSNWGGLFDDVRIYNRSLSASEVHELYRYGTFGIDMTEKVVKY